MANGYLVGQTIVENEYNPSENIFANKQVIKVGISGYPGSTFTLNSVDSANAITLNKYGIYELDVSDVGFLTSCYVKSLGSYHDNNNNEITPPMYIDYIYYNTNTRGGVSA